MFKKEDEGRSLYCDLTRHFKIWLTQNPDVPLGLLNEYRIIHFLKINPMAYLSIIIDDTLFSNLGRKRFQRFYNMLKKEEYKDAYSRLQFYPLSEIERACHLENDIQLMKIVKKEIQMKYPGWTAIASDILRCMTPCIMLGGIYSDFDLSLFFGHYESCRQISHFACLILELHTPNHSANSLTMPNQSTSLSRTNDAFYTYYRWRNDLLIFLDPLNNPTLKTIQSLLIKKYYSPFTQRTAGHYHQTSICNFRTGEGQLLKNCSTLEFVVNTTGPSFLMEVLFFIYYCDTTNKPLNSRLIIPNSNFYNEFHRACYQKLSLNRTLPKGSIEFNPRSQFKILSNRFINASDMSWLSPDEARTAKPEKTLARKQLNVHADNQERLKQTFVKMRVAAFKLSFWWKKQLLHKEAKSERKAPWIRKNRVRLPKLRRMQKNFSYVVLYGGFNRATRNPKPNKNTPITFTM